MTCRKQHTKESIFKLDKGEVSRDTWAQAGLVSVSVERGRAGAAGPPQLGTAGEETQWKAHSCAVITPARTYDTRASYKNILSTGSNLYKTFWGIKVVTGVTGGVLFVVMHTHTHTGSTWIHNSWKQTEIVSNLLHSLEDLTIWKTHLTFQIFSEM